MWDGAGLLWHLSDSNDIGQHWTDTSPYNPLTWAQHLSIMDDDPPNSFGGLIRQSPVGAGLIGTFPSSPSTMLEVPRPLLKRLQWLGAQMGAEFYVDAQGRFHSGALGTSLFRGRLTAPVALAVRGDSGRDIGVLGLDIVSWEPHRDVFEGANLAYVQYGAAYAFAAQLLIPMPGNASGVLARRHAVELDISPSATDAAGRAAALLTDRRERDGLRLQVRDADLHRIIRAGDFIGVFDPVGEWSDSASTITYHGRSLTPKSLRVHSIRCPIEQQQAVYVIPSLIAGNRPVVEITDYVDHTMTETTLEMWAQERPIYRYL